MIAVESTNNEAATRIMRSLQRFLREEDGATAVEYAVLLAGILLACIAAVTTVGGQSVNFWENNQQTIDQAINNAHN